MSEHLSALCGPGVGPGAFPALLLGLLAAGAAGSVLHCAPMCGPFVLGQVASRLARVPAARLCERTRLSNAMLVPYHCGRLATYACLGALAGTAIGTGARLEALPGLLLVLGATLFVGQALSRLAPAWSGALAPLDAAPPGWARFVRRLAARVDRGRAGGGFLLGAALGLLPCGFLYAAITAAAATGTAAGGALCMVAFGLGTAPGLVAVGVAGQAAGRRWNHAVAAAAPFLMLANAALLAAMAWQRFAALA